jgi:hypothetical protein
MKVAGFTIIRNAIKYDYPVKEAILSVLPLCDVFYIGLGNSEDLTEELVAGLGSDKIRILPSVWDESLRKGGLVLSIETNKVFDAIPPEFDWCFYIQSDECVHENDHARIREAMIENLGDDMVDGLLFNYKHFYGQYGYVGGGRRWYRNEIRIIRNRKHIRSYKDAQGFRTDKNKKLRVKHSGASIYHYGWVKPPKAQQAKQQSFHRMWHDDTWMREHVPDVEEFDYSAIDLLVPFTGTHPEVMKFRISRASWPFKYDRSKARPGLKHRFLNLVERLTGWRLGENRNYRLIG